ncbi:MAG TPA: transglutaminase-like domain-containing protein, partial [Thermoanaerobaculia bacterium]|nr:transglutaminase-like domain-containing protein [Thermoanaerobaculia bacterium]
GTLPADLYERTVARSNLRLADGAAVDRLVLRVRPRDPAVGLPDLAAHNQSVAARGGAALVEVRRPAPPAGTVPRRPAAAAELALYLAPNALVESGHPEIVALAREIAGAEPDAYRAALALTRWTAEHMTMDAGIVMAPASELVRERKGTCMGYATLLAALARAAGIPSRIVMGYVYYGGIWGGHAWTEMWLDERWLPFDAAVYAPGLASAARLAAGAGSFADGGGELLGAIGRLFGRVEVEIVEAEGAGRVLRVPEGRAAYTVEGSVYTNPGLGLRIDAGPYAIERADSTWPSMLVVAFRRGATTIELHQRPRHPERAAAEPPDGGAVVAEPEGATLWVWTAAGPDAEGALRDFLQRVEKRPAW